MKIILLKDVSGLGRFGDIKEVADGHARNFLMPRGLAASASERNVRQVNQGKALAELKRGRDLDRLKETARKLRSLTLEFAEKASPSGKFFAALSPRRLAEELVRRGYDVGYQDVFLPQPIKEPGTYEVRVVLGQGVETVLRCAVRAAGADEKSKV